MKLSRRSLFAAAPFVLRGQPARPKFGAMAGDVQPGRALIWSRAAEESRLIVELHDRRINGPVCRAESDFTGRVLLQGLPPASHIIYQVRFADRQDRLSEPIHGSFRTPGFRRDVKFFWSGDTVGQGWGINPEWGGLRIYETMRKLEPDFFLHSGDTIYADGPIASEVKMRDGSLWKNVVTEAKSKPAATLADFRGCYQYNLMDENVRRFHEEVPQIWQWDDHEVKNNWSDHQDPLVAPATQAFREYAPIATESRIYRRIPYSNLLDVFVVDLRSYRGPNTYNLQTDESPETAYFGKPQLGWLIEGLKRSRATWKVIASDMPIGLIVGDGKDSAGRAKFENGANGPGAPAGRELEIAHLLRETKSVKNVVWLTADVHYTAAHHYHPDRARFKAFRPFYEFVSGPLHAGTFGPAGTDDTFGIEVLYQKHPPKGQGNLPPSAGMQFFGEVAISAATKAMTVTLRDLEGAGLYQKELRPA